MGASLVVPANQTRSAKLEFTDHLNPKTNNFKSQNLEKAGVTLAFEHHTLYPDRYERASMRKKNVKVEDKVKFEIEKSTKNSNIIKVTGICEFNNLLQFYFVIQCWRNFIGSRKFQFTEY
jgi:hypothetical protein